MEQQQHSAQEPQPAEQVPQYKQCAHCKEQKLLAEFLRRTGRRSGIASRRGACRACRKLRKEEARLSVGGDHDEESGLSVSSLPSGTEERRPAEERIDVAPSPKRRMRRPLPVPPPRPEGPSESILRPNRQGIVRMRGKTDKGRRWQQETDLETAVTLVREHAAVVVNRHMIRRIYTNRAFRNYILTRDQHICYYCGEYGDTIDHLLPRAKGGHTTPVNCVCACNECNQSKADRSLEEFIVSEP
ncbi:HNH endonuclease [Paenibacillus allorhizosphaerae]|uniref:HNH nuclease domain-containing protein n=1 Tax=Paenibacillus allorhizosphaerae TaxID=2849866 RepID=A0ABN7TRR2_9BACL|nr:HNH endonuclease [Paenibacillus allorhizosphaerae]CAG7646279.1 hypothetical protein PAECIP111802_03705 [Paenibacillus allorhizosphaerae]